MVALLDVKRALFPMLVVLAAQPALAAETRTYEVAYRSKAVGTAVLMVREDAGDLVTYAHHSRLQTSRDGQVATRVLHEEVRVRDGVFVSAWAMREAGEDRLSVAAWWEPESGSVVVRRNGGRLERVAAGEAAGLETLFDAPRRLVEAGAVGARRRIFDLPDGHVGFVVLTQARDAQGWAETEELGIRVRTRWAPGARLPDVIELADAGLVYTATGISRGPSAGEPSEVAGGGVKVQGKLEARSKVRLLPAEAWPGLGCPEVVTLPESGSVCGSDDRAPAARVEAGPEVRSLAAGIPKGGVMARAASLARAIDGRLRGRPGGAALWEADPEQALARGAGDCNEAAAIFAAAAPLVGLEVRRRTGLVLDPDQPERLWPHAWVEVRDGKRWVRVDPSRGEAPATGVYLDVGDGDRLPSRLRAIAPVMRGARVEVVP